MSEFDSTPIELKDDNVYIPWIIIGFSILIVVIFSAIAGRFIYTLARSKKCCFDKNNNKYYITPNLPAEEREKILGPEIM